MSMFKSMDNSDKNDLLGGSSMDLFPEKYLDDPSKHKKIEITLYIRVVNTSLTESEVWTTKGAPLNIIEDATLMDLKRYITTKTRNINPNDFDLLLNNKVLEDDEKKLVKYGIEHGDFLELKIY